MSKARKGFTLIELLVVIGVVAILASILFPALETARERGRAAVCQSNLHQIGAAIHAYSADWDDAAPINSLGQPLIVKWQNEHLDWFEYGLSRYLTERGRRDYWVCPSVPLDSPAWGNPTSRTYQPSEEFFGQGCIGSVTRGWVAPSRSLAGVRSPADTIMVTEQTAWETAIYTPYVENPPSGPLDDLTRGIARFHRGRGNFLFADGHVRLMTLRQTLTPVPLWDHSADWGTEPPCPPHVWTAVDAAIWVRAIDSLPGLYPP